MKIDFITFCHHRDALRLYNGTWLADMIASHEHHFNTIRVVHQNLGDFYLAATEPYEIVRTEEHPDILTEFGIPEEDTKADHYTHGPGAAHYWKGHNINHLVGLKVSDADYIVFSDSDCTILESTREPGDNWIKRGVEILQKYPEVLIVSPSDGGVTAEAQTSEGYRLTQNISQQLFLCERERLMNIDFAIPWDWEFTAPGGPFQEYYYLLEGRMWRYMHRHNLWRCIVPDYIGRYWHWNILTDDGFFIADKGLY